MRSLTLCHLLCSHLCDCQVYRGCYLTTPHSQHSSPCSRHPSPFTSSCFSTYTNPSVSLLLLFNPQHNVCLLFPVFNGFYRRFGNHIPNTFPTVILEGGTRTFLPLHPAQLTTSFLFLFTTYLPPAHNILAPFTTYFPPAQLTTYLPPTHNIPSPNHNVLFHSTQRCITLTLAVVLCYIVTSYHRNGCMVASRLLLIFI